MRKYINTITGAIIQTDSICRGGNWQEVKPPAETPVKEKVSRSRDRKTDYVRKERRNELRNSR